MAIEFNDNKGINQAGEDVFKHKQAGLSEFESVASREGHNTPAVTSKVEGAFQLLENIIKTTRDFNVKDVFTVGDLEIELLRGIRLKRTAFSTLASGSVYSVTRMDYIIGITNLSYAPSIGLPSPMEVGQGKAYLVKDEAGGAATTTITIRSAGDANIDGATSATITTNYGVRMIYTDGNQWYIGGN